MNVEVHGTPRQLLNELTDMAYEYAGDDEDLKRKIFLMSLVIETELMEFEERKEAIAADYFGEDEDD